MIRIRIPDALNDRDHAFIVECLDGLHPRIESHVSVDRQHIFSVDCKRWAQLIVPIVSVGNDTVEPVVSAVKIDQHEAPVGASRQSGKRPFDCAADRLRKGAGKDVVGVGDDGQSGGGAQ